MAERDMEGYVLLNRNILDWRWVKTPNTAYLFILMIIKANFKDMQFEGMNVKRGQFVTSVQSLSRISGLSTQKVRTAISHLKSTNEITITSNNRYSVITIINYDEYQNVTNKPTSKLTGKQQTNNKQITTSNTVNTINTVKKRKPPKSPKGDLTPSGGKQYDNLHAATMMPRDMGTYEDIPSVYRDGTYQSFKSWEEYWDWSNQ